MIHPYATHEYVHSLSHWGKAYAVPEWGSSVIIRDIKSHGADAFGPYPLTVLSSASDLAAGLERLRVADLVSVTLVLDDFHRPALEDLKMHFDIVRPFKRHAIHYPNKNFAYNKHHRYEIARTRKKVTAGSFELKDYMSAWISLYTQLTKRHNLSGLHCFPRSHHETLAAMNGVTAIGAWVDNELVSAHIWVNDGEYVHSHLAASSEEGYKSGAAYAVYDESIKFFKDTTLINLGGGAGTANDLSDGLFKFKRGFANDEAPAYICGAILDKNRYEALSQMHGASSDNLFFPAYRTPRT